MALYRVDRTDEVDWDECRAVVVRAQDEDAALALVLNYRRQSWDDEVVPMDGFKADGSNAKVTKLEARGPAQVILRDFKAG